MLTFAMLLYAIGLPTLARCNNKAYEAMEQSLSRHLLSKGFLRAHNASGYNNHTNAIGTGDWPFVVLLQRSWI